MLCYGTFLTFPRNARNNDFDHLGSLKKMPFVLVARLRTPFNAISVVLLYQPFFHIVEVVLLEVLEPIEKFGTVRWGMLNSLMISLDNSRSLRCLSFEAR